jgi:hypothetical protein
VCGDRSVISGPFDNGFLVNLTSSGCAQPIRLLRHAWETGVDYARLAPRDRLTALDAVGCARPVGLPPSLSRGVAQREPQAARCEPPGALVPAPDRAT